MQLLLIITLIFFSATLLSGCGGVSASSKESDSQPTANTQASTTSSNSTSTAATQTESVDQSTGSNTTTSNTVTVEPTAESESQASDIDLNKAVSIALAANGLAKQGLVSNEISTTNSLASFKTQKASNQVSKSQINVANLLSSVTPLAATVNETIPQISLPGSCGGNAVSDGSRSYDDEVGFPYIIRASVVFDEYCTDIESVYEGLSSEDLEGYSIVFNGFGDLISEFPSEDEGYYEFDLDFSITTDVEFLPPLVQLNQSITCSYFNGLANFNPLLDCATTLQFESDNDNFSANEFIVSGDNELGYSVELSLSDGDNLSYQANFSNVVVCESGNFGSGTATIQLPEDNIEILYESCSQARVSYQDLSSTISF